MSKTSTSTKPGKTHLSRHASGQSFEITERALSPTTVSYYKSLGNATVLDRRGLRTKTYEHSGINCSAGVPCEYPEEVDLRIIVLTYNRPASLQKLLTSLNTLILDGCTAYLEIWIDCDTRGKVDDFTVKVAENYRWKSGRSRVHKREEHAGLLGQWIDTWRPAVHSQEMALILEDDLTLSPYAYRWLRAAKNTFTKHLNRDKIAGYTLQSENVNIATTGRRLQVKNDQQLFAYQLLGSWGFSPDGKSWRLFQDWYHQVHDNKSFHPYVKGLLMTKWYRSEENKGKKANMWTMWFIHFSHKHGLFTVYNNLKKLLAPKPAHLAINRYEKGLHFTKQIKTNNNKLLVDWNDSYVMPSNVLSIPWYNFDGHLNETYSHSVNSKSRF